MNKALAAFAILAVAPHAKADTERDARKLSCAVAYEQGQRLRKANRLLAARGQLLACSDPACPDVLRRGCADWLREVDAEIPSVVLVARDASGVELIDVRVELDGRLLIERLDGKPVSVDPGRRSFRFVRPDGSSRQRSVELAVGDRERAVDVRFEAAPTVSTKSTRTAAPDAAIPAASWVLAGVGVAALAGFGYFALDGRSKKSELDDCRPGCDPNDVDAARRSYVIGDVLLAIGVSAIAGATLVYAASPREAGSARTLSISGRF
jgi:hypothetical protein